MTLLLPAICLFACVMSISLDAKQQTKLALKTKFLASLAVVGFAWELEAQNSLYGQIILIALILCMVGDVLLAIKYKPQLFISGIGAFLLAHIAYAAAFVQTGFAVAQLLLIAPAVLAVTLLVALWLRPHLQSLYKKAVPAYLIAIGLMLICAWSNQSMTAWWWIVGGASLFAISDLLVARNRFVKADVLNRVIGLPMYYLAQLILAYSTSLI